MAVESVSNRPPISHAIFNKSTRNGIYGHTGRLCRAHDWARTHLHVREVMALASSTSLCALWGHPPGYHFQELRIDFARSAMSLGKPGVSEFHCTCRFPCKTRVHLGDKSLLHAVECCRRENAKRNLHGQVKPRGEASTRRRIGGARDLFRK